MGRVNATLVNITGNVPGTIVSNDAGWAEFRCNGGSVSVWVQQ